MTPLTVWAAIGAPKATDALVPLGFGHINLREVEPRDAADLAALFRRPEITAHLSMLPTDAASFADWAQLSHARRGEGRAACYTVVVRTRVAGLFIASRPEAKSDAAEVGVVLAPELWGTGVFPTAARLFIDALFARWPVARLTGRSLVRNHRGVGAMRKLGAVIAGQAMHGQEVEYHWELTRAHWTDGK